MMINGDPRKNIVTDMIDEAIREEIYENRYYIGEKACDVVEDVLMLSETVVDTTCDLAKDVVGGVCDTLGAVTDGIFRIFRGW